MANIGARGDREDARWRKPDGAYVVLTVQGRVLHQRYPGDAYQAYSRFRQTAARDDRVRVVEARFPGAIRVSG